MGDRSTAPRIDDLELPTTVGRFEILSVIGSGGMGVVYRARDLTLGRTVALKCPRADFATREDFRRRFASEAKTASMLTHPNITTVYEVFEARGLPWLVMEFVEGSSLRARIARRGRLPFRDVLKHSEGLADALRTAHDHGVLHRDVNPNNIILGDDGYARLTDFGLAKALSFSDVSSQISNQSTQSQSGGRLVGTRGYLAPEQILGKTVDRRSDLFSFGLVMYEMCTGRRAFNGDSSDWIDKILHHDPESISQFSPDTPEEFDRIVATTLAKLPYERYQSASDLLADLRRLRQHIESGSQPQRLPSLKSKAARTLTVVAIIAGLTAAVATAIIHSRTRPDRFELGVPRQITSIPGWEAEPAMSPDGRFVAYSSNQSGNPDIWLVEIDGGTSLRLTDDVASDTEPTWFPSGSEIAFTSIRSGSYAIWKVPVLGGPPVMVVDDAYSPAISPDGSLVAFTRRGGTGADRVFVTSVTEPSKAIQLTGNDDGIWDHLSPSWSPDGTTICYSDFRNLWMVPATGGKPLAFTTEHETDRDPLWSSNGHWIYFSSMRGETTALWRKGASGGEPVRLTIGTGPESQPSRSSNGDRLAYSTYADNVDIVIMDRQKGTSQRLPGGRLDGLPAVSPRGDSVVFSSNRKGKFDLWRQEIADGQPVGDARPLTDHPGSAAMPSYSPDGKWIAYYRVLDDERDIWMLPSQGGVPHKLTDHPGVDVQPSFSPDGTWIAFSSDRSGVQNIWVAPVVNGQLVAEPSQISNHETECRFPTWSNDGTSIAYVSGTDVWLTAVPPRHDPLRLTHGAEPQFIHWDPAGDGVFVVGRWGQDHSEVRRVPISGEEPHQMIPPLIFSPENSDSTTISISRDGRIVAYSIGSRGGDIWVLDAANGSQ